MNFYSLSDNSFGVRGVVWMRGSSKFMIARKTCPVCGSSWKVPEREIHLQPEISRGTFWPDSVDLDGTPGGLYISERVKMDWDEANIKYGRAWDVKIDEPYPKKLIGITPPKYYWIDAPVGIELDYEASGFVIRSDCKKCGYKKWTTPTGQINLVLKPETWTGLDIFGFSKSASTTFCTQRVLDLAIEKRWTNFEFIPINTPQPAQPIPYLKISKKLSK